MTETTVRLLTSEDAQAMKEIREEALRLHPESFSADAESEAKLTVEDWRGRLEKRTCFGAFRDGALVGIAGYAPKEPKKMAHTGEFGAMYVRQSARGTGAADALIEAALQHAAAHVEQLLLMVTAENARAIRLYERHGFRKIGRIPRSLRVGDRTFDDLLMWRPVSTSD